jgi:glutamine amidotransferase
MCRVLGYLGPKVRLADLITRPKNSLINQTFDAEYHHMLQLAGGGFASWEKGTPDERDPLIYKSCQPAFYDKNLQALCAKLETNNLLAHVRATGYSHRASVHDDNCHPFLYPGFRLALAHNGGLPGWREMRSDIMAASKPEIVAHLAGSTDTETLYCLLMSQYEDPTRDMDSDEIIDGLARFMRQIIAIKQRHKNGGLAKLKFFLADGNDLVVANIGLGFDYATEIDTAWEDVRHAKPGTREHKIAGVIEPVWYLSGSDYGEMADGDRAGQFTMRQRGSAATDAVVISSEHLTEDASEWTPVEFQDVVFFRRGDEGCQVEVQRLAI